MRISRTLSIPAGAFALLALSGLVGCMSSETKASDESAVGEQSRQVSAKMVKPVPLNAQGEVVAEITPEILTLIKEDLGRQGKADAAALLDSLYDPATGKFREAAKLPELQHEADAISSALSKAGAK